MKKSVVFPLKILTWKGFLRIIIDMKDEKLAKENKKGRIYALRAGLTAACIAVVAFIFFNSLRTGDESTVQSSFVTDLAQKIVGFFAPNSWIANATGADYERFHGYVRTAAHFSEFALLGALMIWCWRSYTRDGLCLLFPLCLVLFIPILDESLQLLTAGRAATTSDLFVDTLGGACGCLFAAATLWIGLFIRRRKRRKKEE